MSTSSDAGARGVTSTRGPITWKSRRPSRGPTWSRAPSGPAPRRPRTSSGRPPCSSRPTPRSGTRPGRRRAGAPRGRARRGEEEHALAARLHEVVGVHDPVLDDPVDHLPVGRRLAPRRVQRVVGLHDREDVGVGLRPEVAVDRVARLAHDGLAAHLVGPKRELGVVMVGVVLAHPPTVAQAAPSQPVSRASACSPCRSAPPSSGPRSGAASVRSTGGGKSRTARRASRPAAP